MSNVHAVILAGGSGSRLWPLSRQHLPKQFLVLDGEASLLQTTINRLSPTIDAKSVLIVTQEAHAKGEAYHALFPYQSSVRAYRAQHCTRHRIGSGLPDGGGR